MQRPLRHARLSLVLALSLASAASAPRAQAKRNTTLLAQYKVAGEIYNDVWGYVGPQGREFALLGTTLGTRVVETTVPAKPVLKANIPGAKSLWRDIKTYGTHAYIVTEGDGNLQIVDLSNVDAPKLVKAWNGPWTHAHNIVMDAVRGIAIVCGTSASTGGNTYFLDVKTDPVTPKLLRTHAGPYYHDMAVQNGILYAAAMFASRLDIFDFADPKLPKLLSSTKSPLAFASNVWPTRDGSYLTLTEERPGGGVSVYDVRNKALPKLLATWRANPVTHPRGIPHNAYVLDSVVHVAYYTEGYRSVDISNPNKPVEVGFLDGGSPGVWGCYPFQPSGTVYVSDQHFGLQCLRPLSAAVGYGRGTPSGAGKLAELHPFGSAWFGNTAFGLRLGNAKPASLAILVVGATQTKQTVNGIQFLVGIQSVGFLLPFVTDARGEVRIPVSLPTNQALAGLRLFSQALVLDGTGALGFSASRGMQLELFVK